MKDLSDNQRDSSLPERASGAQNDKKGKITKGYAGSTRQPSRFFAARKSVGAQIDKKGKINKRYEGSARQPSRFFTT